MKRLSTLLLVTLVLVGCHAVSAPVPGSANSFDSTSYLTLVTTDNIIQNTKSDLAAGAFPANMASPIKVALNGLIQAYDVANPVYQAYHAAAMAGTATPAQQAAVSNSLVDVQVKTAALTSAKGGK